MRLRHLWPAVVLLAAACKMGPDYERPALPVPQVYNDSLGRDSLPPDSTFADLPWWEVFRDPTLQQLIRAALANNLDLAIAAERVIQAEQQLGITRADLFPQVNALGTVNRAGTDSLTFTTFTAGLTAFWELDLFGRIRRGTERDRAFLLASEEGRRAVVLALVSSVASAYIDLRTTDLQLEIARRTAESRLSTVTIAQQRFEGGVTGEIDYRQAQAQYEDARTLVIDLQESIARQEHALSVLLGRAPGAVPRGRPIEEMPVPDSVPAGLPSSLLDQRPDLRAAEAELHALTANVGVAKAALFPNISLTGALGFVSTDLDRLFRGETVTWNLGGSIFQPIFQGGRLRAGVRLTEAQMREELLPYRSAVLQALQETEDALVAVRLSGDRTASVDSQVVYNRTVLRLAELRYDGGVAPFLEVLDAQRTLLDTELLAADARRLRLLAYVALYRALGGGWQEEEVVAEGANGEAMPPPEE